MIREAGNRAAVDGTMTLPGATALLTEGIEMISRSVSIFDLGAVTEVDSSGLAVLFGWLREAQRQGKTLQLTNPPKELMSLAEVYGVSDLLPLV